MKEKLNDKERGVLIFMIEEYFKTTHNFRGIGEVNGLAKKKVFITPYSFIDFANSFNLENLLCSSTISHKNIECTDISKVGHTGIHSEENDNIMKYAGLKNETFSKIPNMGFPEIKNNYLIKTNTAKSYLNDSDLSDIRSINEFGKEDFFSEQNIKAIIEKYKQITRYLGENKCSNNWNNNSSDKWFFINFFPSSYYVQKKYIFGQKYIGPSRKMMDYIHLNHEPFIRIFSNQREGCSINSISKKNKFKTIFHLNQDPGVYYYHHTSSFGSNQLSIEQLCILFTLIIQNKKISVKVCNKNKITDNQVKQFIKYLNSP
jgi:hypothetical protein